MPLFAEEGITIRAANLLYEEERGRIEALGGVYVHWRDVTVWTEKAVFLLPSLELLVPQKVEAILGKNRVRGDALWYSFARKEGWIERAELFYQVSEEGELLFRGQRLHYLKGEWRGEEVLFTGCHRDPPLYSLRAKEITIFPEERLVAKELGLYLREQKVLVVPVYSLSLGGRGGGFSPDLGYRRDRGYYLRGYYEYPLSDYLLFEAQAELSSRRWLVASLDLVFSRSPWEARIFADFRKEREDTVGGYVRFQEGALSFSGIWIENQVFGESVFSRRPQYVFSWIEEKDTGFSWEVHWSTGCFEEKDISGWRNDLYVGGEWKEDSWGVQAFFWHTLSLDLDLDLLRWGGRVWWEENVSPHLTLGLAYRFITSPVSPFSFDPQRENEVSAEFLWGSERETFLRARGVYDLEESDWDTLTLGLGIGSEQFSVGAEGIYSFEIGEWTDRKYFIRKRFEDCIEVEASFWEPDQSFFVSLNFLGLDQGKKSESLFDQEEEFSLFTVERNEPFH